MPLEKWWKCFDVIFEMNSSQQSLIMRIFRKKKFRSKIFETLRKDKCLVCDTQNKNEIMLERNARFNI